MPMLRVTSHACDGSGRKRTYSIQSDHWSKSTMNGSFGSQPLYRMVIVNMAGTAVAWITIYEDRSPHRKLRSGVRLWRWDVFPCSQRGNENYSAARGDCVSLKGAKMIAREAAKLFMSCDPFIESVHRA